MQLPRRPASIPEGLVLELSRGNVLPSASAQADAWMQMLDERVDECVATIDLTRAVLARALRGAG